MATRLKTIEFATQTIITTLASATSRDLSGSTLIYIPETGGTFAFKSVTVEVNVADDNGVTSTSLTSPTIGIILGGVAVSSAVGVNPVANSGEEQQWVLTRNVTSYFTTNWVGTSMSWVVRITTSGPATANHFAKIYITYQYDDTSAVDRQIKTIRIPIESTRSLLTTTYQTIGGQMAIPNISGVYLPEIGKTIRQVFVELWGNTSEISTGNFTWQTRFSGTLVKDTFRTAATTKNSAQWVRSALDITGNIFLSGSTSLEGIVNTTTSRMCNVGGMIVVTYEFDTTTSDTIYNSLILGAVDTSGSIGGPTSADQGVWERNIYIEEPGTITLKESGLSLYQNDSAGYSFFIKCSGDTTAQTGYTSYLLTTGSLQAGAYSLMHRIDSGGQNGGNGISLNRGKNLYRVSFYSNTTQAGWNLSGYLILNYTSGKHTDGVGTHAHTCYQHITDNITAGGARVTTTPTVAPTIPETYYYLLGYLFWVNYSPIGNGTAGALDIGVTVQAEVTATDTAVQGGDGWVSLYNGAARSDSENQNGYIYAAARSNFNRWNGDPDPDRLNIKTSRKYRIDTGPLWTGSMGYWYTYSSISYVISGTCTGYIGTGSGIPVDIYRVVSPTQDEMILSLTTTTGGIFNSNWIDNTDTLYAVARQDDSHVGRSTNGVAG